MIRFMQLPGLALIYIIVSIHADRYNRNIKIGPLFHFIWAGVYSIAVGFIAYRCHSWTLLASLILERFVVYNPLLNKKRIPKKKFFYLGTSVRNRSWWDDLELLWAAGYPYIWSAGTAAWIVVNCLKSFQ